MWLSINILKMYSKLFVLFSAITIGISMGQNTADTQFCQCQSCCSVDENDFDVNHNPTYLAYDTLTASNKSGVIYDTVIGQANAKTVNHYFTSLNGETVDCSSSKGYMYQNEYVEEVPLAVIDLVQHDSWTCFANFSETATSAELSSGLNFYYAFKDLSMATPAADITLDVFEAENIIPLDPPVHEFYAKDSLAPDSSGNAENTEMFFEIQTHHRSESPFQFPNVDGAMCTIQNGASSSIAMDFEVIAPRGPCRLDVDWYQTVGHSPATIKYSGWFNQSNYELCAAEVHETSTSATYVYRVKAHNIGAPGVACDYDDAYERFTFNITIDTTVNENGEQNPVEEFQSSMGAFTIDSSSCETPSTFLPTAKIGFTVTHETARASGFDTVTVGTKLVNDVLLSEESTSCTAGSGSSTCTHTFKSTECLPLKINDDGSCQFNFLPYIQTSFTATYVGIAGVSDTNEIFYDEMFDGQSYSAAQCANIKAIVRDLTKAYGTSLAVTGDSLLNDISVQMTLDKVPGDGQITLELQSIDVRLESTTGSGAAYERDFLISEKVRHMESSVHPYHSDGHFCRKVSDVGVCTDFYAQTVGADTTSDRYTSTSFSALVNGLHPTCPGFRLANGDLQNQNTDKFTFNPQRYVFKHFQDLTGKMIIDVVGRVRLCENTTGYQALQDDSVEIVNLVAILDVSNSIADLLNNSDGTGTPLIQQTVTKQGKRFSERDTALIAVLSAVVPIVAILICAVVVMLYFSCKKGLFNTVEKTAEFVGLSKIHNIKYSRV
jgi:hypothetical protein